jgi:hypothetical protein
MLRLATDADADDRIMRGLVHLVPELDLVRSVEELPERTPDQDVLEWAAGLGRVLVTNDRNTMMQHILARLGQGLPVPGIIFTTREQPIRAAINDLHVIVSLMSEEEMAARIVVYLPFRN